MGTHAKAVHVSNGSWLCENAKRFDGDRRSYSSKTVVTVKLASELNFKNELKNVLLAASVCRGRTTTRGKSTSEQLIGTTVAARSLRGRTC